MSDDDGREPRRDPADLLVDRFGAPVRVTPETAQPCACGAPPSRRVRSAGFGPDVHDVCGACGHEFVGEHTV